MCSLCVPISPFILCPKVRSLGGGVGASILDSTTGWHQRKTFSNLTGVKHLDISQIDLPSYYYVFVDPKCERRKLIQCNMEGFLLFLEVSLGMAMSSVHHFGQKSNIYIFWIKVPWNMLNVPLWMSCITMIIPSLSIWRHHQVKNCPLLKFMTTYLQNCSHQPQFYLVFSAVQQILSCQTKMVIMVNIIPA